VATPVFPAPEAAGRPPETHEFQPELQAEQPLRQLVSLGSARERLRPPLPWHGSCVRIPLQRRNISMKIGLFIPCYIDAFFPEVGVCHTADPRAASACSVDYPLEQNLLRPADGQTAAARKDARRHRGPTSSTASRTSTRSFGAVRQLASTKSDATSTRSEQTPEARKVRAGTRGAGRVPARRLENRRLFPGRQRSPHKVGLHDSCSAVRWARPHPAVRAGQTCRTFSKTRNLLSKVRGLETGRDRPAR